MAKEFKYRSIEIENEKSIEFITRRSILLSTMTLLSYQQKIVKCIIKALRNLTSFDFSLYHVEDTACINKKQNINWAFYLNYGCLNQNYDYGMYLDLIAQPSTKNGIDFCASKALVFRISFITNNYSNNEFLVSYNLNDHIIKEIKKNGIEYKTRFVIEVFNADIFYQPNKNGELYVANYFNCDNRTLLFNYLLFISKKSKICNYASKRKGLKSLNDFLISNFDIAYERDVKFNKQQLINTILYKIDHKRIENLKFFHFSGKVSTKYSSQILSITNKGLRIIYETSKKRKKLNLLMNKRKKFKEKIKRMMKYNKKVLLD